MADVAGPSFEDRLGEVVRRTMGKVGPEVAAQLRALVEPRALKIMGVVLAGWVVGHALAYGEVIDFIVGVVGLVALGTAVFSGMDELYDFARDTYRATTDADLDAAADHLAKAIAILGIQAVLAVIFRQRPVTKGRPPGEPAPFSGGRRYSPVTRTDPALSAGRAYTSWYGDIVVSTQSSGDTLAMFMFHERVHQFLTPKLYFLRDIRVEMRVGSYTGSSLWRWLEEMLAYTVGYGRVRNWSTMFKSVSFPTRYGYVYWIRRGSDPNMAVWEGRGIVPEGAGLIATGLMIGVQMELWFKPGPRSLRKPEGTQDRAPVPAGDGR